MPKRVPKFNYRPSADEKRLIRDCAKRSAGRRAVKIEPGERYHLEDGRAALNIAFLTDPKDWDNWNCTDLHGPVDWKEYADGFNLTTDGRGIIDFYVYEMVRCYQGGMEPGDLMTNVTAYYEGGKLIRIEGTGNGIMWPRQPR
jgi:hypothetical protein